MPAAATSNVITRLAAFSADAGQPDLRPVVEIERFDHWHNQPDSLLAPTSITWVDQPVPTGRAA
ncbi:hypothetical protein [Actinophytocola gossypii]|uniref:Uncharacterized protein n=1 Tax=Actinophytocola gossypii TaxID=2812003 RepID=A0ABT2J2A5_9PSEU|nr:hypothetical protein [Actinophytocola gossypii]MCT2581984.1 hypothetical protein [Actinophytocola gossypii]